MACVLIVDDDEMVGVLLERMVRHMGHQAARALTVQSALDFLQAAAADIVLLDVHLPDGNGLDALPLFASTASAPEIIIITSAGDANGAEAAIVSGAWDYIRKPLDVADLRLIIHRAIAYRQSKRMRRKTRPFHRDGIVGSSSQLLACLDIAAEAADSDAAILICGPTGTGKELMARAVHDNSARAGKPFVTVDCASLPHNLMDSMLFGHKRGAFTGAGEERAGLIKQADGGTLFLDEVGEMPLEMQKVFLRVLQERTFRPLGQDREIQSDFRLIAATNRNLEALVEAGQFRSDLMYRLQAFVVTLPPLCERGGDIVELAVHHIASLCRRQGLDAKGLSREFIALLESYDWPGNIRELTQVMERALVLARNVAQLHPEHLPRDIRAKVARASSCSPSGSEGELRMGVSDLPSFGEFRRDLVQKGERDYLEALLKIAAGDSAKAMEVSGLSKTRLYELLRNHEMRMTR